MEVERQQPGACWDGATVSTAPNNAVPTMPFGANGTTTEISARVWSERAGASILRKIDNAADPTINVESLASTTQVGTWETITWDVANPGRNTNPINAGSTYNKISVFFQLSLP